MSLINQVWWAIMVELILLTTVIQLLRNPDKLWVVSMNLITNMGLNSSLTIETIWTSSFKQFKNKLKYWTQVNKKEKVWLGKIKHKQ